MGKKSLKVDREQFEGVVKRLLHTKPVKREDVRVSKNKPGEVNPAAEVALLWKFR
jgi:hypothetical protein